MLFLGEEERWRNPLYVAGASSCPVLKRQRRREKGVLNKVVKKKNKPELEGRTSRESLV